MGDRLNQWLVYLFVGILWLGGLRESGYAQVTEAQTDDTVPISQLEINKKALLTGSDQAAGIMLASKDPLAREELLNVLADPTQTQAHLAICKALETARAGGNGIWQKEDFIEPLLSLLSDPNNPSAARVPEALLIYDYQTVGPRLEAMAQDSSYPETVRLNTMRALQLQPDKHAVITIVKLVDDPSEVIADRARQLLYSLGITMVGKDAGDRARIIQELEEKSMDQFLRDWLIQQESRVRDLRTESDFWKDMTLKTLDRLYAALTTDTDRSALLVENLQATQPARKLWALEKVHEWRMTLLNTLPPEFSPVLAGMVSDKNSDVRLAVADLLALLPQVDSVAPLMQQLAVETNEAVKIKLFAALGFALVSDSKTAIPMEAKQRALQWAADFLDQNDVDTAWEGAKVIRKLLEKTDLESQVADRFLRLLAQRATRAGSDSPLKVNLLTAMASLCDEQHSNVHEQASEMYQPVFLAALKSPVAKVREQGVDGLIRIDRATAFERLKTDMLDDPDPGIRAKIIALAETEGRGEDLEWLARRAADGLDLVPVGKAITAILTKSSLTVMRPWIDKLMPNPAVMGLTPDQWQAIMLQAFHSAESEPDKLASQVYGAELLRLHLAAGRMDEAAALLVQVLQDQDLDPKSGYAVYLGQFCHDPNNAEKGHQLIETINQKLPPVPQRPNWSKLTQSLTGTPASTTPQTPPGKPQG